MLLWRSTLGALTFPLARPPSLSGPVTGRGSFPHNDPTYRIFWPHPDRCWARDGCAVGLMHANRGKVGRS